LVDSIFFGKLRLAPWIATNLLHNCHVRPQKITTVASRSPVGRRRVESLIFCVTFFTTVWQRREGDPAKRAKELMRHERVNGAAAPGFRVHADSVAAKVICSGTQSLLIPHRDAIVTMANRFGDSKSCATPLRGTSGARF
jgi:hypothetical protein